MFRNDGMSYLSEFVVRLYEMSLLTEIGRRNPPHPHDGPSKPEERLIDRYFYQICPPLAF